ncbi:hypothetical protein L484_015163 [Morus notabilis]|uniref:Uncharacterized protein n=1 Tax=Morus notabilis TaxID=981085 RepID=W9SDK3_9ROSA|nr:hypothetical protein L484_015163 [Morus notabilis]
MPCQAGLVIAKAIDHAKFIYISLLSPVTSHHLSSLHETSGPLARAVPWLQTTTPDDCLTCHRCRVN